MGKNNGNGIKPTTKQKGSFEQTFEFKRTGDRTGQTTVITVKESEANGLNAAWIQLATSENMGLNETKKMFERLPRQEKVAAPCS